MMSTQPASGTAVNSNAQLPVGQDWSVARSHRPSITILCQKMVRGARAERHDGGERTGTLRLQTSA